MKKIVLIPIIVGSALLLVGGVLLAIGLSNNQKADMQSHDVELNDKTIEGFDFDLDVSDVTFYATTESSKKVSISEYEKQPHTVEVVDNVLTIKNQDNRKWHEKIFNWGIEKVKVDVYLPAGEYASFVMKNSTGDITIPKEFSFTTINVTLSTGDIDIHSNVSDELFLKTSTGDISYSGTTAKGATFETSTGSISINDFEATDDVTVTTGTGRQTLKNVKCQNLTNHASTGKVVLENVIVQKHIEVITSTGDVKLIDSDAETLFIKTSTGDVTGTLLSNKNFVVKSGSGDEKVPESDSNCGRCEIKTSTGDIKITIKK